MNKRKIVPLRLSIHYGQDGFEYPDFGSLPPGCMRGLSYGRFVDLCGGWFYDRPSGFGEVDDYNPDPDVYFGLVLAPVDFAKACVERFPGRCAVLTDAELITFWDRCHADKAPESVDAKVLDGIRARYGPLESIDLAGEGIPDGVRQAMDPDHPSPGIVANVRKTWPKFAARRHLKIDTDAVTDLRNKLTAAAT